MNTFLLNNLDLEVWEGWVGQTHSMASTWNRKGNKALCGFQVFHASVGGGFTLMLLDHEQWTTPLHQVKNAAQIRKAVFKYISAQIEKYNTENSYNFILEASFKEALETFNRWLNDQIKTGHWLKQNI